MTPEPLQETLARLDELHGKATAGEWIVARPEHGTLYDFGTVLVQHPMLPTGGLRVLLRFNVHYQAEHDVALVAALRNAYPALRARLEVADRAASLVRHLRCQGLVTDSEWEHIGKPWQVEFYPRATAEFRDELDRVPFVNVRELRADIERLRSYTVHRATCAVSVGPDGQSAPCTCGLETKK